MSPRKIAKPIYLNPNLKLLLIVYILYLIKAACDVVTHGNLTFRFFWGVEKSRNMSI
jgi:hypothetical protein